MGNNWVPQRQFHSISRRIKMNTTNICLQFEPTPLQEPELSKSGALDRSAIPTTKERYYLRFFLLLNETEKMLVCLRQSHFNRIPSRRQAKKEYNKHYCRGVGFEPTPLFREPELNLMI
ncbi:hypothetical protein AVEN_136841-1 [Araneus ventricosus]|uniref:Uncharacterized protein n=1 Tax=Araneus ventricosus TaxID=182803 RepID=A0A4Y2G383_ARAVE|nr:hypothetical protein AVEN_136841-1 [Araneus ventricosus]